VPGHQQEPEKTYVKVDADLEDLIPGFLENRQQDAVNIMEALQEDDYEKIRFLGHNMKGAGGGYGFDGISDIGWRIEKAAHRREAEVIKEQVKMLQDYLAKVEIVWEEG